MEEGQGPKITSDMPSERSISRCDSTAATRDYDAFDDDEADVNDDGQLMSTEQNFEFLQGSAQEDEGGSQSPSLQSDPFYHDWPYWTTPLYGREDAENQALSTIVSSSITGSVPT